MRGFFYANQDAETVRQRDWKVKAEVEAEKKRV
jgi:hypothetical protein